MLYPLQANSDLSKLVSITEAKAKLSDLMAWTVENDEELIVQRRGVPTAVIIPFADYDQFKAAKEQNKRQVAIARIQEIATEAQRNHNMTAKEVDKLADEITREAIDSLVAKGEVTFQE